MNISYGFAGELVQSIGWALVHTTWQAIAVALMLAMTLRVMRSASAQLRYTISCIALGTIILAAAATMMVLRPQRRAAPTLVAQPVSEVEPTMAQAIVEASLHSNAASRHLDQTNLLPWLVGAWAVGVLVLSCWQLGGWMLLRRYRASATPVEPLWRQTLSSLARSMNVTSRVNMALTNRLDVPVVIGTLRPMILIPVGMITGLSTQQIEAILAHELAHVRRHDYLVNLIQTAIETILFYHPAVWWISLQIRREREFCCDDLAAAVCGGNAAYVDALAALEESRGTRLAPAFGGRGRGELLRRAQRLLNANVSPRRTSPSWAASMMLILSCLLIPLGSGWLVAQNRPATAPANPSSTGIPFRGYVPGDSKSVQIDSGDFIPSSKDYQIGAGDQIELTVADLKRDGDTVKSVRVPESGVVTVPVLGPVQVSGLTEADAELAIQKGYKEKKLLENARVGVTITEARSRTFTIMGSVARPGKYAIIENNFRLFDALALAGGGLKGTNVRILRDVEGKPDPRIIDIPGELIISGDPQVNIIIRPKDYIILTDSKPQAAGVPTEAIRITVMPAGIMQDGKLTDWARVRQTLEAIPQPQRQQSFIALLAGSTQLNVRDYFDAQAEAQKIVSDLGLGYLSNAGISRTPFDPTEEYFVGGEVPRTGVYSMKDRTITLRQAIISAGMLNTVKDPNELKNHPHTASIVRKVDDRSETFLPEVSLADLFDGKTPDVVLKPGDQIMVRMQKHIVTTAPANH